MPTFFILLFVLILINALLLMISFKKYK